MISIDARTADALREHRKTRVEIRLMSGLAYQDQELVFGLADGRPLHPDRMTQLFRDRCKAAGLP